MMRIFVFLSIFHISTLSSANELYEAMVLAGLKGHIVLENHQVKINPIGIALGKPVILNNIVKRVSARSLNQELQNREAQFEEFIFRHSSPVKNFDELEDSDIAHLVAYNLEPLNSESLGFEILREYAMTDFGAKIIARILKDSDQAIKQGFITSDGALTSTGKKALLAKQWYGLFVVGASSHQPSASFNSIQLPQHFKAGTFPVGGLMIDPMALVHHEFGHTRFSSVNHEHRRKHLEIERDVVIQFENPIRYLNTHYYKLSNYKPRQVYFDNHNTIVIKTGNIYQGPAYASPDLSDERVFPYFYKIINGSIRIDRDTHGLGLVDFSRELQSK